MTVFFKLFFMRVKPRKLKEEDKIKSLDALYTSISSLKTRDDIKSFLRDLLTEGERIMIGRRILIAQRLLNDEPYDQIMKEMKVGPDTITRVDRWLSDQNKGYEKAVQELEKTIKSRRKSEFRDYYPSGPFANLKRRYPAYFLLNSIVEALNKK